MVPFIQPHFVHLQSMPQISLSPHARFIAFFCLLANFAMFFLPALKYIIFSKDFIYFWHIAAKLLFLLL